MKNRLMSSTLLILALSIQSTAQSMENDYETANKKYNEEKASLLKENGFLNPFVTLKKTSEASDLYSFLKEQYKLKLNERTNKHNRYELKTVKELQNWYYLNNNIRYKCSLNFFEQKGYFITKYIALEERFGYNEVRVPIDDYGIAAERTEIHTKRVVGAFGLAALTGLGIYWFAKK